MSDRPLHEVVAECAPTIEVRDLDYAAKRSDKWVLVNIGPQLAAVLKAADALRESVRWNDPGSGELNAYDAAAADLRRALEGK